MKVKRVSWLLVVAIAFAMCVPFTVLAGPGEWDYLGSSQFDNKSKVFNSGGGDFRVCTDLYESKGGGWYTLYEYDPDNADDVVARFYLLPGDCGVASVRNFVDGTNGKAELYLYISDKDKAPQYTGKTVAEFWD